MTKEHDPQHDLFLDFGRVDEPLDLQDEQDLKLANSLPAKTFRLLRSDTPTNVRFLIRYTNDQRALMWSPHPLRPGTYDRFGTIAGWFPLGRIEVAP